MGTQAWLSSAKQGDPACPFCSHQPCPTPSALACTTLSSHRPLLVRPQSHVPHTRPHSHHPPPRGTGNNRRQHTKAEGLISAVCLGLVSSSLLEQMTCLRWQQEHSAKMLFCAPSCPNSPANHGSPHRQSLLFLLFHSQGNLGQATRPQTHN